MSIRVRVRLFALLRDLAGTSEVTLELPEGATCSDAIQSLLRQYPQLQSFGERVACAVNRDYVGRSATLQDQDELALIPPVSGGALTTGAMPTLAVGMPSPAEVNASEPQVDLHRKRCKRYNVPGHAHFLTFSCFRRQPFLSKDRTRGWCLDAINLAREEHEFDVWAYVLMPEHVHLILFPRREDYDISRILTTLKQPVSKRAALVVRREAPQFLERMTDRQPNGKEAVRFWQRGGGYDSNLWNPKLIWEAIDYLHNNPVKRGLCASPELWPWSSAVDYMELGKGPVELNREHVPPRP